MSSTHDEGCCQARVCAIAAAPTFSVHGMGLRDTVSFDRESVMHDPARHIEYLRQSLRQDKSPIGFFLGAGCPVSIKVVPEGGTDPRPLIPDIAGMTSYVRAQLDGSDHADAFAKLMATFDTTTSEPNIEDILSAVRALAVVVGTGTVHGLDQTDLANLEQQISASVVGLAAVDLPQSQTPYRTLAAWAGTVTRARPVEVFSTNYDLLLEQALEEVRVPYFDGFVGARRPFFDVAAIERDEVPSRWVRVWKLHGSINWRQEDEGGVTRTAGPSDGAHALIHPSHLKYEQSRRMPYLALIDRLRAFLRGRGAALLICGYSFNDQDLNEVLIQGLEGNPTAAAFGLLFGSLTDYERARSLAVRRPNFSLLAADAAIVGTREAPWEQPPDELDIAPVDEGVEPSEPTTAPPLFALGDFAAFGSMLGEMVGERSPAVSADGG